MILYELSCPPILAFPGRGTVEDSKRLVHHLGSDACLDRIDTSFEQVLVKGSVRPIVCISPATAPAERNWTVWDLEVGGTVWAMKRCRGYHFGKKRCPLLGPQGLAEY